MLFTTPSHIHTHTHISTVVRIRGVTPHCILIECILSSRIYSYPSSFFVVSINMTWAVVFHDVTQPLLSSFNLIFHVLSSIILLKTSLFLILSFHVLQHYISKAIYFTFTSFSSSLNFRAIHSQSSCITFHRVSS